MLWNKEKEAVSTLANARRNRPKRTFAPGLFLLGLLALGLAALAPQTAEARGSVPRGIELEIPHMAFHKYGLGGAIGMRVGIPISRRGFLPNFPDVVSLSIGADAYYTKYGPRYGAAIGVPILLHWGLFLTDFFSIYFELGANIFIHEAFNTEPPQFSVFFPSWIMGAFGMKFHLTRNFALNIRLGAPYSSLGLSFYI